jgi:hypothetical protein
MVEADAASCPSFGDFDGRVQAETDELVAHAGGDELLTQASALSRARRTCARESISHLLELREQRGSEAVELELEALARAFSPDELKVLLHETLGAAASDLRPQVLEVQSRRAQARGGDRDATATPRPAPERERERASEPASADTPMCVEATNPCEAAACIIEQSAEPGVISSAARRCLDSLRPLPPLDRAVAMATLAAGLRSVGTSGPLTETLLSLETVRRQLWPQVDAELRAQRPALAAQLARPFAVLDSARDDVERVRLQAIAFHLALSRQAGDQLLAARLHRLVAAQLKGPAEPPLTASAGRWATPRWGCSWAMPELPAPFDGVELRLAASCRKQSPANKRTAAGNQALITFDLERELERETISGTVTATCAGRTFGFDFSLRELVIDASDTGRAEALVTELHRLTNLTQRECAAAWAAQARRGCEQLHADRPVDLEQRFASAFAATGRWEPCFAEHFARRYGVTLPLQVELHE